MTVTTRRATLRPTLAAVLILMVAATVLHPAPATASTGHHPPASHPLRQSGHAPFGDCPARDVQMTVTVADPVAPLARPFEVTATVTNTGPAPCHYSAAGGPPTDTTQVVPAVMGPCGAMSLAVYRPARHEIWPGDVAYSCPLLVSMGLLPHQTITVIGTWSQQAGPHSGLALRKASHLVELVPAGRYQLVVDGRFRFTIRVH